MRFAPTLAEPARCWVRWAPRSWPGPRAEFLDLASGGLASGRFRDEAAVDPAGATGCDDTVYLPPAGSQAVGWRRDFCAALVSSGLPVLAQHLPGEDPLPGTDAVYDLTAALLASDWDALSRLPREAAVIWPLIAGLTDAPEQRRIGFDVLAEMGARVVMALVPTLSSEERRRLSALGDESTFDALFHGSAPSRLEFASAAARRGFEPFLPRPRWPQAGRVRRNRELAARLALVAELLLLLDRPEGHAQAFYSAARRVEAESQDFQAIAREGNLGIVEWLRPDERREIECHAAGSQEGLLRELLLELRSDRR